MKTKNTRYKRNTGKLESLTSLNPWPHETLRLHSCELSKAQSKQDVVYFHSSRLQSSNDHNLTHWFARKSVGFSSNFFVLAHEVNKLETFLLSADHQPIFYCHEICLCFVYSWPNAKRLFRDENKFWEKIHEVEQRNFLLKFCRFRSESLKSSEAEDLLFSWSRFSFSTGEPHEISFSCCR